MTEVPIQFEPTSDSPLPVSSNCPTFEMIVALGCAERYICLKRCTYTFGPRSKKRPIYLLCAMCLNLMVPIQFEPNLEGRCLS